jgi:hypothetical protein
MQIKEFLEIKSLELEERNIEYGKKVLKDLELFEVVEVSREEYLLNRNSLDYLSLENSYFRLEYPKFTNEEIEELVEISKKINDIDEKMTYRSSSTNLSSIFKGIGVATIGISFLMAFVIGGDAPAFTFGVLLSGALISVNYFAIAEVLKLLKKIMLNTESKLRSH